MIARGKVNRMIKPGVEIFNLAQGHLIPESHNQWEFVSSRLNALLVSQLYH